MTITNLILDPLLIFGIGPFPELGMAGAALATVVATIVSVTFGTYQLGYKEKFLLPSLPTWVEFSKHFKDLTEIAIPAVLANTIVPLTAAFLTRLVSQFGNHAVAGFGVGSRIEAVSLMIVYALSSTLPMFIGQNLGAGKLDRVYQATFMAFKFVLILQFGVYVVLAILAPQIATLFSDQAEVRETIMLFLWIVPLSYGVGGIVILINVAMNVLGKPKLALYINIIRLVAFYLPLAWLGALYFGIHGLFIGIAIGNVLAWFLARRFLIQTFKKMNIAADA